MLFWLIVAAVVGGAMAAVLSPLWRRTEAAAGRASHDLQVLRDQLHEVDRDAARGLLAAGEAEAARIEVSRRLLAAADAEAGEAAPVAAPRRASLVAAAGVLAAGAGALGLYASLGAPGFRDQPRAERMAAAAEAHSRRPGQDAAEAEMAARPALPGTAPWTPPASADQADLVDRLAAAVAARPNDLEGHRLLARSLAALGRFAEARRALARVIELGGPASPGGEHVALAELMIRAANGYVSPEAEAALAEGLRREPANPLGRYLSGLTLLQAGRPDLAHPIWARLLAEGPADAPWTRAIAANIDAAAAMAGLPPGAAPQAPATPFAPGPGAAEMEAAEAMDPAARAEMIGGMVSRLADRLAAEGGPPADWARLVRSLRVLNRLEEADSVAEEAQRVFAADPAALAEIAAAAAAPSAAAPSATDAGPAP